MIHKTIVCSVVLAIIGPIYIQCISVIGPRILRPFGHYSVAVAGDSRAYTLYVAVEGKRANGEQYTQGREVQVQPGVSRLIDLDIDDPGPGQYALVARSTSGPQFSSSAPVVYQPRSYCVFVQTDKRVYRPKDTINFRVIALDKYLLPVTGSVDVSVLDSGGSPVRQWAAVPLDTGFISEELVLADEPALGEWTIQVEMRGQTYSRQVLVADYVMPKFHMDMRMPKEILFSQGRFNINVTAKHFNNHPVRGELTISAYAVFFSGLLQPVFSSPARKVIKFNGHADVVYDLKTDLDLAEDAARPLVVEAVLEEKGTLIKQNVSSRILLLRTPYRLKITAPDYFKPTLPYNVQIEVVDPSGKIMDIGDDVTVERLWDDGAPVNVTTLSLSKGHATYTLVPDASHTNSTLNLVIKYKDVSERAINIQKSTPSGGQFLTIELLTRDTNVGDNLRARVLATEPMDILHYAVLGRGVILFAKTLELSPAQRSVEVSAQVVAAMAPGCVLLAWHPPAAGSPLLAAAVYAPIDALLQHKVSVSVLSSGFRPDSAAEFQVTGKPGSHAALLAEDANAILAGLAGSDGQGSGLSIDTIEREVESFSGIKHSIFKNEDQLPSMGLDLGGNSTSDVFKNAGIVILTDSIVTRNNPQTPSESEVETGTRPPLAGPYAFSRLPPPPSPRYYLTVTPQPTWMLANFSLGADGKAVENRRSPATAAEWTIGAFAIHPTLGLGLAKPPKLTTSIPLSLTSELPASLQRGETLAAVVTLKSTLTVDTSVEITFHNSEQYFEFEPLDNSVDSSKKIELFRRERIVVPARGAASTAFLVTAVRAGEAPIIVEATGNGVSASLFRTINVNDGYVDELWYLTVLDGRRGVARGNVTLSARAGMRVGPATLVAAGDLLAEALSAARAPPAPAADPPHALRPLALACLLIDYLQATEREEVSLSREAREQAAAGYQRLMAYRRSDGSFASEISQDAEGDVWMTATAGRWLSRCARHVPVAPGAGAAAARWLVRAQRADGGWDAPAPLARNDPRAQAPIPLAAHALMALLQAQGSDILHKNAINKAVDYVARGLSPDLDAYPLAVVSAALAAAKHPQASQALQLMSRYANYTGSSLFWSRKLSGSEWRNPWLRGNSLAASTAAWGLRAMLASQLADQALPVARYILEAFRPADLDPDVVDALAEFAKTIKTTTKLRVSVNLTGFDEPRQFNIDNDNALIIQPQLVPSARSGMAVTEGRGIAVVGLTAKTSTNVTAPWPRFTLDPRVDQVSTKDRLQLSICVGFVPQDNETESGLTLLTVQLPSGYLADINTLTELTSARHVSAARLQAGGSRVVAWLHTSLAERCATLAAPRALPVARQRPGYATLEDLYDSSHRARVFFQPITSTTCDVCSAWPSCERACGTAAGQRAPDEKGNSADTGVRPGAAATSRIATSVLILAILTLLLR